MSKKQSKSRKQQKKNNNQLLWMGGVIVVLTLIALAVVAFSGSQAPAPVAESEPQAVAALPDASVSPQRINPGQYVELLQDNDHVLIDVRTPGEFDGGHIDGAININSVEAAARLDEFPRDQTIVLYCRTGNRSNQVAQILRQAGFTNVYDLGGIVDWTAQGLPTVQ